MNVDDEQAYEDFEAFDEHDQRELQELYDSFSEDGRMVLGQVLPRFEDEVDAEDIMRGLCLRLKDSQIQPEQVATASQLEGAMGLRRLAG